MRIYCSIIKTALSTFSRAHHTVAAAHLSGTFDTYLSFLQRCAAEKNLQKTRQIHLHMKKSGFPHLSLGNKLVHAYLKCGDIDNARETFDAMPRPHVVLWNAMISACVRCRRSEEGIEIYKRMLLEGVMPDEFTFSSFFRVFADFGLASGGRAAHAQMVLLGLDASGAFIGSALVDMYAKLRRLGEARLVYDRVGCKDVVLATALIVGYTQNGDDFDAIRLFRHMHKDGIRPNDFTFASVLIACGNVGELNNGIAVHGLMFKLGFDSECSSQTSLLNMYSKCGLISDACKVFGRIKEPNIVAWTAIIGCLVCNNKEESALSMLRDMIRHDIGVNEFTLSTALSACSSLALFENGKMIHVFAIKNGLERYKFVGAALIDMYGKCGRIGIAKLIFDDLRCLDLVSINSMINAYAQNGHGLEAIKLFDMMQASGIESNNATFVSVLSACSNAGLLEEGRRVFSFITKYHRSGPSDDHYACMVDLLGRVGKLNEAEELITKLRNPNKLLWRTLLNSCKMHGELNMAIRAARKVLELDPNDDGTHILLSNTYASLGQWDEVIRMKSIMRKIKVKKEPAMTWIEVQRQVSTFMAGDKSHQQAGEIYRELEELIAATKKLGYVPKTIYVLQEMDETEKEKSLYHHSEKLAVAFGVLSSRGSGSTSITIFKNLRVCGDCHCWLKLVTLVLRKEIIARDAKRFHHFKDGQCSCNDYW